MSLRRIAGIAVAAAVVSGAGLLLSGGTGEAAPPPPTPVSLEATGMSSTACPAAVPVYGSIAFKPGTTVQFKPGVTLAPGQTMTLSVLSEANTTPAPTAKSYPVPASGVNVAFSTAGSYALGWKTSPVLGVLAMSQKGKLVIDSDAVGCKVVVQVPTPSAAASALPSPITSAINGAIGGVVSTANGALGPVNSAIGSLPTSLPTVPPVSGLPSIPPLPGVNPPATSAPAGGAHVPGTNYKPSGPTVADRTVPKGYGSGSGVGGVYVPATSTGESIVAGSQQSGTQGKSAGSGASSAASSVKNGGSPRTVELASNRPRSALGALPTLAVILAILALSGATAFYARTFLLQPAEAPVQVASKS